MAFKTSSAIKQKKACRMASLFLFIQFFLLSLISVDKDDSNRQPFFRSKSLL